MDEIILKEVGISITKGGLGAIPFVGTALNETIFDCRGRVKQQRANKFIEELSKYMQQFSESDIKFDYIKSEEFGDIFESILRYVVYNRSEEKLHRFKKILVNQMISPYQSDSAETFLDLVSKINEKQLQILNAFRKYLGDEAEETKQEKHEIFDLDKATYLFYIQDLISKGLMFDDSMNRYSTRPFKIIKITELGIEFLRYIERH